MPFSFLTFFFFQTNGRNFPSPFEILDSSGDLKFEDRWVVARQEVTFEK